jgi:hypothetical protein
MEASAQLVWDWANALLRERDGGRSCCFRVEARENEANAACFEALPSWFRPAPASADAGASSLPSLAEVERDAGGLWEAP